MNRYRELASNTLIFTLGSIGSKLLIFFLVPLYTHYLTKADYGIADLVFSIGQLFLPFVSLAIFNGLLRFGLMPKISRENVLLNSFVVFLFGSLVMILLSLIIGTVYPILKEWRWYLAASVITSFAFTNTQIYLKVKDYNRCFAFVSVFQAACLMGMNILLIVLLNLGVKGYLLSTVIANGVAAFLAACLGTMWQDFRNAYFDIHLMKEMIIYSVPFILNDLAWWGINSANKVFLEIFFGTTLLGIFAVASKLPLILNTVAGFFLQSWGLSAVREYDSSNDTGFYSNILHFFVFGLVGVCIIMISCVKPFMGFYVEEKFFMAWQYMPVLLVCAGLAALTGFFGSLYSAMKMSTHYMYTTLLGAVVNVVVSYVAIQYFDIWGAVIGTMLGYIIIAFSRWYDVCRFMSFSFDYDRALILFFLVLLQSISVVVFPWYLWINMIAILVYLFFVRRELRILYGLLK